MRRVYFFLCLCMAASALYAAETGVFTDAQRSFWSLQPVTKPAVPVVKGKQWVSNPVDAFVLASSRTSNCSPTSRRQTHAAAPRDASISRACRRRRTRSRRS